MTTNIENPPPSGNDNGSLVAADAADAAAAEDTTHFVAHPRFVRYVIGTLRCYGVDTRDRDALADVQTATLEAARAGRMPATLDDWKALGATIAASRAIDGLRHEKVQDKYDAGLCDDADPYEKPTLHWEGRDPVDTKRYLAVLEELFDQGRMPPDGAEILWGEAEDVPHEEIAAELGVTVNTVDKRLQAMRTRFRTRLAALGLLTVTLLVGVLIEAPIAGVATREESPRRPDLVQVVTAGDRAALFRREGVAACGAGQWRECLSKLDAASKLDPAGDAAPEVRAARHRAGDALYEPERMLEAKPR